MPEEYRHLLAACLGVCVCVCVYNEYADLHIGLAIKKKQVLNEERKEEKDVWLNDDDELLLSQQQNQNEFKKLDI